MSNMRCISVWQPWAWLIVNGHKDIENRTWRLDYRGPLIIHAGKAHGRQQLDDEMHIQHTFPNIKMPPLRDMQFGAIVGIVEVMDCVQASNSPWFNGPWGWVLERQRRIQPVQVIGRQGLFAVSNELVRPL